METTNTAKINAQRKSREVGTEDRLSPLPEEIICHILSFLPTKQAVGTSVVSKRFKYLWTRVSDLDFDNLLVNNNPLESSRIEVKRRDSEFSLFADRVLRRHQNLDSVRRFRFQFSVEYYDCELSRDFWCTWMESASDESQLEEIDIRLNSTHPDGPIRKLWSPPASFFALKNLKVLKLNGVIIGIVPGSVFLSSLKILQLLRVRTENIESLSRLISGCSVLETLHLEDCHIKDWYNSGVLTVSLSSLKNLTIINYCEDLSCNIEIEAPSLEHLRLREFEDIHFMGSSSSSPLSCLRSAWIDIHSWFNDVEEGKISYARGYLLIGWITHPNLQCKGNVVILADSAMNDNIPLRPLLPLFNNLTHLTIQGSMWDWGSIPATSSCVLHTLLNSASKLQYLLIDLANYRRRLDYSSRLEWEESEELACTPECMLSSLEEIKIKNLIATEDEMKMVAYLLKAGAVLKKVNMHLSDVKYDVDLNDVKDCLQLASLLKLPRGSSACEAHLYLPNGDEINNDRHGDDNNDNDDDDWKDDL